MRDSKRGRVPEAHAQRVIGAAAHDALTSGRGEATQEAATKAAPALAPIRAGLAII